MNIFPSPPNRTSSPFNTFSHLTETGEVSEPAGPSDRTDRRDRPGPHQEAVYSPIPPLESEPLVGKSDAFRRVRDLLDVTLQDDLNLLIQGECGTGRSRLARTLHARSERRNNWLIIINCQLTRAEDLTSLLMGASTGGSDFEGILEVAAGGTVVLDHVDALDAEAQAHLNHILETHAFPPSGGDGMPSFGVRLLSIASEQLSRETFQPDLYHKLAQFPIAVPPLRERGEDVVRLARHFLRRCSRQEEGSRPDLSLSDGAKQALRDHSWPGNVRELRNAIARAVAHASAPEIAPEDLMLSLHSAETTASTCSPEGADTEDDDACLQLSASEGKIPTIEEMKREAVERAYELFDGNVDRAAVELGVSRSTVYRMLERYGIT